MAYLRPTLAQIFERKLSDLQSRLTEAAPQLRRSILNALIRSSSKTDHNLHGHIDYVSNQIVPDTADDEYLLRHAAWWGLKRAQATYAVGTVPVTGTGTITAGDELQRLDGVKYIVDEDVVITSSGSVTVTCEVAGANGNADAGEVLSFVSPVAGIESQAIAGELSGGADIESVDSLRTRLRERVQKPPHGGALHDYVAWAKQVAGVTRVWPLANWLGDGTVGVCFVRDGDVSLIPASADVDEVQAQIDQLKPVTAKVTVFAPTEAAQDFTVSLSPNSIAVQTAVAAELTDLFSTNQVEDGNGTGTVYLSKIRAAVSAATGEDNNAVSLTSDITPSIGEIATLGTISYQSL
jgi:uncharacterized phage protein gp47/JayE